MGNNYITTTERSGLTVAQVGGNDIYRMLHQIRSILELDGKLGEDYLSLFAEPVDGGRTIDWYADDEGKAVRVMELPREERQQVLQRFREMFESLHGYAEGLRSETRSQTYRNYADILEKAVLVPGIEYLYAVNGKPVLVGWGFSEGDSSVVEEGRKLIKQIEKTIAEDKAQTQPAPAPTPAAMPFAGPEEEKPAPEPAPQPAPEPKPEPAPKPAAPEEPLPEETPAPDLSWENNILREDPAPDSPDAAESPVFGTELRRNDVGTVTFLSSLSEMPQESWDVSAEEDGSVMAWAEYDDSSGLYDLYIGAEGGVAAPEDCSRMFCYYEQLREISFNGAFHTDRVTTMEAMFGYCYELTGCDLSGMSAPEVTSMEDMFYNCENLTEVSTRGMSCASLLDTSTMFWQCHGLREVDISGLATENVEDMSGMFGHCTSLETLDVSFFNTSRVTNMETMFAACKNLTAVDVGAFDTSRVTDMSGMFTGCERLTELDVGGFDTSGVVDLRAMFYGCEGLSHLDVVNWDTSSAELVDRMFFGCTNLAMPDFSGWDLSNVTSFEEFAEGTEFSFMILMFDHSGI